jgi:hypothetical protein
MLISLSAKVKVVGGHDVFHVKTRAAFRKASKSARLVSLSISFCRYILGPTKLSQRYSPKVAVIGFLGGYLTAHACRLPCAAGKV